MTDKKMNVEAKINIGECLNHTECVGDKTNYLNGIKEGIKSRKDLTEEGRERCYQEIDNMKDLKALTRDQEERLFSLHKKVIVNKEGNIDPKGQNAFKLEIDELKKKKYNTSRFEPYAKLYAPYVKENTEI